MELSTGNIHCFVAYAVVTYEIKLFQNYFRGLLQLTNIFQHVHCR